MVNYEVFEFGRLILRLMRWKWAVLTLRVLQLEIKRFFFFKKSLLLKD
jgi:hypothetical protein